MNTVAINSHVHAAPRSCSAAPPVRAGWPRGLWAAAILLAQLTGGVQAQETGDAPVPPMVTVEVAGVRDPALMAYRDVVMLRDVFAQAGASIIRPGIRVASRQHGQPVPGLRVQFHADGRQREVPLRAGFALLAELPVTSDPDAEFLTNQRRGSLAMEVVLTAEVNDPARITMREALQAIDEGNRLRGSVLPWYLRLVAPKFERIAACFDTSGQATVPRATVEGAARQVLEASPADGCITIKPSRADRDGVIELDRPPLFIRVQ